MCLQHYAFFEDSHLTHSVSKWLFSIQHLKVDDSNAPDVNFWSYDCALFLTEALRRKVPVCANTLRCEFDCVFFGDLAEAKVCDLDSSLMKKNVLWLQIIVDHFVRQLMKIPNCRCHLSDDQLSFSLRYLFVLFQIVTQIGSLTKLKDCAKGV